MNASDLHTTVVAIDGMNCASCVGRVERAIKSIEGVSECVVNLASARATVSGSAAASTITATLQSAGYPAVTEEIQLQIEGMNCASCLSRVEKALAAIEGVVEARVNLANDSAVLRVLDGSVNSVDIDNSLAATSYSARIISDTVPDSGRDKKTQDDISALGRLTLLAAVLAAPVVVLEMGSHLFNTFHHWIHGTIGMQTSWLIQFLLTTVILAWPGRYFFSKGIPALIRGEPDMNSLVAVGTSAAWLYSVVATFFPTWLPAGSRAVYFEAAAVIVVLILLGRFLEARSRGKTGQAIRKLAGLREKSARVERESVVAELPVDEIVVDDVIHIRAGERLAVDGIVTSGHTYIDESMLSGEPVPVEKNTGDAVTGGTVNGTGTITVRATRVGTDTTLAQIIRLVQQAQGARLPVQALVNRITEWFVPCVLVVAILTVAVWLLIGPEPSLTLALVAGVSVLIIACPCAMGLATPTSIMVGTGRAAELGVLFRKGSALQTLHEAKVVALDKTGTLTLGQPVVTDIKCADGYSANQVLQLAASVEIASEHPIARAIVDEAKRRDIALRDIEQFETIPGMGVSALVNGSAVFVGADRWLHREQIEAPEILREGVALGESGKSAFYIVVDDAAVAVVAVADPIRDSSKASINALQRAGLSVAMITGDSHGAAAAVATELNIDQVVAEVMPQGKLDALQQLRVAKGQTVFVGDGINDAPALATADVGIAIGTGTDVAIESADVVLMSGDLRGVVNAFEISRQTMKNIRQNLFWAFGYNVLLIPVAAGVLYPFFKILLSPMLAAAAMALSSVFVLSNALRLRRVKPLLS